MRLGVKLQAATTGSYPAINPKLAALARLLAWLGRTNRVQSLLAEAVEMGRTMLDERRKAEALGFVAIYLQALGAPQAAASKSGPCWSPRRPRFNPCSDGVNGHESLRG